MSYDSAAWPFNLVEPSSGLTIAMTYNAAGLRASYTMTPYGSGSPEQFTYRGGQLAQTVVVSGTSTGGGTNRYWYQRDGLGNVVALTDVSGNVVGQYAYDLWGKPTLVQETVPQQLRYQGYWYDNELGWYWLTTRSYDPSLKRFLQPDPSQHDGLFSYVYVSDDPVDGSDPSGFFACWYKGPLYDGICPALPGSGPGGGGDTGGGNGASGGTGGTTTSGGGGGTTVNPIVIPLGGGSGGVGTITAPTVGSHPGDASPLPARTNGNCLIVNPLLQEVPSPLPDYAQYYHWFTVTGSVDNYCANTAVNLQYRVELNGSCPFTGLLGALGGAETFSETVTGNLDRNSLARGQVIAGSLFETSEQPATCYTLIRNDDGALIGTQFQSFDVSATVQIFGQDLDNRRILYSSARTLTQNLPITDTRYISWV